MGFLILTRTTKGAVQITGEDDATGALCALRTLISSPYSNGSVRTDHNELSNVRIVR